MSLCLAATAQADTIRIATYHTELSRDGPALLARDLIRGEDPQIAAVVNVISAIAPDILLLQGVDHDYDLVALGLLAQDLAEAGQDYPFLFAAAPNTGVNTGLDLDEDGRLNQPRDAQGYGRFTGEGGMAVLSRFPILQEAVQDFSPFLWRDLPGGAAGNLLTDQALAIQRLPSVAAWEVPIDLGATALTLLAFHATPPVFDGPEDRNGHRNQDELRFWQLRLEGWSPDGARSLDGPVALMGVFNADPIGGEARREVLEQILDHPRLQDPTPQSDGAAEWGDATDTVDWSDPVPGNLRVSYILPSTDLTVLDAGVFWPASDDPDFAVLGGSDGNTASRHRLVWVDLVIEGAADR